MPSTTREYAVSWWLVPDAPVWVQQKGTVCLTANPPARKTLRPLIPCAGAMPRLLEVQWPVSSSPHDEIASQAVPHAARIT